MKKLKFGWLLDDLGAQYEWMTDEFYPPKRVSKYFNAEYYIDAARDIGLTLHDAVQPNGRLDKLLVNKLDVLFVQCGSFDMYRENADRQQGAIDCETLINKCRQFNTLLVLIDYPRVEMTQFKEGDWRYDEIENISNYFAHLANVNEDIFSTRLWWNHHLKYQLTNFYYINDTLLSDRGNALLSDIIACEAAKAVNKLFSSHNLTYAVIGDSWCDVDSVDYVNEHWTRKLGDVLGIWNVCDASVGGWTCEMLYNDITNGLGALNQIDWVLLSKPDIVMMTITGNDIWCGIKPELPIYIEDMLNRLKEGGVKLVIWQYYSKIGFDYSSNMFHVDMNEHIRWFLVDLKNMIEQIVEEKFPGFVVFVTSQIDDVNTTYLYHPERYSDPIHPNKFGWPYFVTHALAASEAKVKSLQPKKFFEELIKFFKDLIDKIF